MQPSHEAHSDPVLLELFRAEMDTHLPVLSQGLLALEKGRAGDGDLAAMMRAAHSIKGAARIVGMDAAVRVSHVMEDCFTAAREQRITLASDAVDVLLQGVDALQRICTPQAEGKLTAGWLEPLLERIAALRDGRLPTLASAPPPDKSETTPPTATSRPPSESRVVLPADFNDKTADRLRSQLCEALSQNVARIRLDFARIERVSAGALALLAALVREAGRAEPAQMLTLEGVSGPVAALLRVTGLERAFTPGG